MFAPKLNVKEQRVNYRWDIEVSFGRNLVISEA